MVLSRLAKKAGRLKHHLRQRAFQLAHPRAPWIVKQAWVHLEGVLRPDMVGFEWGCGRSTLYLADKIGELVSVEHNEAWYQKIRAEIERRGYRHVKLNFIPRLDSTEGVDWETWPGMRRLGRLPRKPNFFNYFNKISEYPDGTFDLLLIDGRARLGCMATAVDKVKPGGIVVLDNSERDHYQEGFAFFEGRPRTTYSNGLWETTIWSAAGSAV